MARQRPKRLVVIDAQVALAKSLRDVRTAEYDVIFDPPTDRVAAFVYDTDDDNDLEDANGQRLVTLRTQWGISYPFTERKGDTVREKGNFIIADIKKALAENLQLDGLAFLIDIKRASIAEFATPDARNIGTVWAEIETQFYEDLGDPYRLDRAA